MKGHYVEFEEFEDCTLNIFLKHLEHLEGIELSDLKVSDLSMSNGKIVTPGEGVYLFRRGTEVLYVGKVSSMSFTERIGKHFDVRRYAWFNRFLKLIAEKVDEVDCKEDEYLIKALEYALKHCNLILINFKERKRINKFETVLRRTTNPLNKFKHERRVDATKRLVQFGN
ncbi:MAG: hypothetical protein RJQ14_25435 [Marinoscillum sp.]